MEHHIFLQQAGTAWIRALIAQASSTEAEEQTRTSMANSDQNFQLFTVAVAGNQIFFHRYGNGPPMLMIHRFPRTSLVWRDLASQFTTDHTLICVDLPAYSGKGGHFFPKNPADTGVALRRFIEA